MWRVALIAALVALAAGIGSWILLTPHPSGEGGFGREAAAVPSFSGAGSPAPAPQPVQQAAAPSVTPTLIATLSAQTPYSSQAGGPPAGTLPAQNPFGAPTVLAIIGQPDPSGWAQVELPIRPNGSLGYIQTGDGSGVSLTETTYSVKVSLASDTLTVMNGNDVVMTVPAAVGAPKTPTPPDHTYLWELIRPDNPNGAYGPYIFGLAEFSDAYSVFNGGDAQIGIHGQDEPSSVGHPVSHGCIRLDNGVIAQLAGTLPLGTPVTIS